MIDNDSLEKRGLLLQTGVCLEPRDLVRLLLVFLCPIISVKGQLHQKWFEKTKATKGWNLSGMKVCVTTDYNWPLPQTGLMLPILEKVRILNYHMDYKVGISDLSSPREGSRQPSPPSSLGCLWKDNCHIASMMPTFRLCHDVSHHQGKNQGVSVTPVQTVSMIKCN